MKLGLGSYAYAWAIGVPGYPPAGKRMDAFGLVRRAAQLGVHLVQIDDNIPLHIEPDLDALLEETRLLEVDVEVGTRGIGHEHLRAYMQIARQFHSPILRIMVDTREHQPQPEEIVETLRELAPEFERENRVLAIENPDRMKARTLAEIIEQIGSSQVGVCLDVLNALAALEGPDVTVETLGPYVVNLHVKDFAVRRANHGMGLALEGRPAGKGILDVRWLLERLHGFGREFNAIIELWPPLEASIEQTIRTEDRWAAESVAYMQTLILETGG